MKTVTATKLRTTESSPTITLKIPDPARVAIVKRITHCTEQKAAKVIRKLDEHDQRPPPAVKTQIKHRTTRQYTRFTDLMSTVRAGLIQNGFTPDEASKIQKIVCSEIIIKHAGHSTRLPTINGLQKFLK